MAPLEGFDCTVADSSKKTAEPELNNNVLLLEEVSKPAAPPAEEEEEEVHDDLGQRLLKDHQVVTGDKVDKEVQKRVRKGRQLVWHNIVLITFFHSLAVWSTVKYIHFLTWPTFLWCE